MAVTVATALSSGASTQGQNCRAPNGSATLVAAMPVACDHHASAAAAGGMPDQAIPIVVRSSAASGGSSGIVRRSSANVNPETGAPSRVTDVTA